MDMAAQPGTCIPTSFCIVSRSTDHLEHMLSFNPNSTRTNPHRRIRIDMDGLISSRRRPYIVRAGGTLDRF